MKKIESLFVCIGLLAAVSVVGAKIWNHGNNAPAISQHRHPTTKYGAFLAAQHAVYVNDFDSASAFAAQLDADGPAAVQNTRLISEFMSGRLPENAKTLGREKTAPARMIYDAYLVSQEKWSELYKRHKSDESALTSPLRVWSAVATGRRDEALKFIEKLPTNESWKSFIRGQIYAETGDQKRAAKSFADVRPEFMNINDYLYIMSFYTHHDMPDAADALRAEFTMRPGGMFMMNHSAIPNWQRYKGHRNAMAFSLLQNVSHTQVMMYSDLALLLLRFAQIAGPQFGQDNDAIDYYLGQFFFNNTGDYAAHFAKIGRDSPFYPFAVMRGAEKSGDIDTLRAALRAYPLFVPAMNKLIAHDIQNGNKRAALRTVERALESDGLSDAGHAFFLKSRAHIHHVFGDLNEAQSDLHAAADVLAIDAEIMSLQAKIWAAQNRQIDNAYEYAMTLVRQNPTDVMAWDTLGCVVRAREGTDAALEVLARVGQISATCSSLFEHLGDLYAEKGDNKLAQDAYMRAIDLSDDGLTVVSVIKKKIRKLK